MITLIHNHIPWLHPIYTYTGKIMLVQSVFVRNSIFYKIKWFFKKWFAYKFAYKRDLGYRKNKGWNSSKMRSLCCKYTKSQKEQSQHKTRVVCIHYLIAGKADCAKKDLFLVIIRRSPTINLTSSSFILQFPWLQEIMNVLI